MRAEGRLSRAGWLRTRSRTRAPPLVAPWIPQAIQHVPTTIGLPLFRGWFKNAGTLLLTGSLWSKTGLLDSPYLELLPRAARHPFEFWGFVVLAVLFIGMGALRMARANAVCASILAVLLCLDCSWFFLPRHEEYIPGWYVSTMLPGVVAVAAVGIVTVLLSGLQRVRGMRWAPFRLHCSSLPAMRPSLADTPSSHVPLDGAVSRVCGNDPADTQPQCTGESTYHHGLVLDVSTDLRPWCARPSPLKSKTLMRKQTLERPSLR